MGTPFSEIYNIFFRKIENDITFFHLHGISPEESLELANERAYGFLNESIARFMLSCYPEVDMADNDPDAQTFNFELTSLEKYILASMMYEIYLQRNFAKLNASFVNFTPSELTTYSPAAERNSIKELYDSVKYENRSLIDHYSSVSRDTGERKSIDYTSYAEEE